MRALALGIGASLLLTGVACRQEPSAPAGAVQVALVENGIQLTNGTGQPIAYAVWARGFLGLFAPCADVNPGCVRLGAGASVVVPFEEIVGMWQGEREAMVWWWRVVPDGAGGYRVEDLREIVVSL